MPSAAPADVPEYDEWRAEHEKRRCQCPGCPHCNPQWGMRPCANLYNKKASHYQHAVPNKGLVCCPKTLFEESCAAYWYDQEKKHAARACRAGAYNIYKLWGPAFGGPLCRKISADNVHDGEM